MTTRRPILSWAAILLAALLLGGVALPTPTLWQCRHAASVAAVTTTPPSAMPCAMAGSAMKMGTMACCRPAARTMRLAQNGVQRFGIPSCDPKLITIAPIVFLPATHTGLDFGALLTAFAMSPARPYAWTTSMTVVQRSRPPPSIGLPASERLHLPGLRAPPAC